MHIASKNPFAKQILHEFLPVTGTEWTVTTRSQHPVTVH